jgi:cell division septum initiation protein DivIVA
MKPEEFQSTTNQILTNLSDQGKVTEYLNQITEAYTTAHTTNTTLAEQQTKYEKEIQALKETNMNLFLKIQTPPEQTNSSGSNAEPTHTYDKLLEQLGGN